MNKFLKWLLASLFVIAIGVFCYSYFNDGLFKKPLSPKKTVSIKIDDLKLEVFYKKILPKRGWNHYKRVVGLCKRNHAI